ncbi:zincin [Melanomma pulvis-pyrius CBS 109.77]|uniref:Zincin n=1 Tax=Melanomma pulvis-pyrius CBS 109.77 TaxID=1314802 RepID=A0A6A6XMB0_9PLEO|nr:zincin [Melanomma pulvis-pyrius CBS 109.77]
MAPLRLSLLLLGASSVLASPARVVRQETVYATQTVAAAAPSSTAWNAGAVSDYPIHSSCNATERAQLTRALGETVKLAQHAKEHILRWGNSSEIYQKYFGNASTGEPIGWFEKVVNGDKAGVIFRCDNPDGNCAQEGWGGHWRGSNATSETVICPLSYSTRWSLESLCGLGYTVANGATNFYWASDLLHRLFHVPKIGEGAVEHYAGEYDEVIDLAQTHSDEAVKNSDTLQYFALEAYAFDIAVPGEGCAGKWTATSSEVVASQTSVPTATSSEVPSVTSEAAKECHTHADGVEHCT